jgi:hypothetical protein
MGLGIQTMRTKDFDLLLYFYCLKWNFKIITYPKNPYSNRSLTRIDNSPEAWARQISWKTLEYGSLGFNCVLYTVYRIIRFHSSGQWIQLILSLFWLCNVISQKYGSSILYDVSSCPPCATARRLSFVISAFETATLAVIIIMAFGGGACHKRLCFYTL